MTQVEPGHDLDALVSEYVLKQVPCSGWVPGPFFGDLMKKCDHPDGVCNPEGMTWGYSTVPGWSKVVREWLVKKIAPYEGSLILVWLPTGWHGTIRIGMMVLTMHGETPEHILSLLALRMAGAPVDFGTLDSASNPSPEELATILGPEFDQ